MTRRVQENKRRWAELAACYLEEMIQPGGPAGDRFSSTSVQQVPSPILELQHLPTGAEGRQEKVKGKAQLWGGRTWEIPISQEIRDKEVKISHHTSLGKLKLVMDIKNQISIHCNRRWYTYLILSLTYKFVYYLPPLRMQASQRQGILSSHSGDTYSPGT